MNSTFFSVTKRILIVCFVIFVFFIPGCGDDNETTNITPVSYSLSGTVTGTDNITPVNNATCTLEARSTTVRADADASTSTLDSLSVTLQTDGDGKYIFNNLSPGIYKLRVSADNYVTVNIILSITAATVENVRLIALNDWSSVMGQYPYEPSSGYILIHSRHEGLQSMPLEDTVVSKDPPQYQDQGYVHNNGTVDWEANDTHEPGQSFFYGVKTGQTYTVTGSKDGYTFDGLTGVEPVAGEIVSYILEGTPPADKLPQKMSDHSFLSSGYNADGTLISNPVVYEGTETVKGIKYIKKKLTHNSSIAFNGKSYTVYSFIPEYMTISSAYKSKNINEGKNSEISADPNDIKSAYSGDPIWLAKNTHNVDNSKYYIPNLPNTAGNNGLTENVAWTVDQYANISTYTPSSAHSLQYGWAFDPGKVKAAIIWNKLIADGGHDSGSITLQQVTDDHLVDTVKGSYDPNQISPLVVSPYPFPDPSTWLKHGAFVNYQPIPGFQLNLLRNYTPWGAWTLLQNTCGLFVRKDGGVEIPLDSSKNPYPLVVQTWTDQQFTVLNLTDGPVPATNDQYPGDEKYYMGNTYLPGEAGVITRWLHYPSNPMAHQPDERDSDGWFGFKGDKQEDVMAWNDSGGDQGGQGRKPYMVGAAEYGQTPPRKLRVEHSNSFWYNRTDDSGNKDKMYKISYHVDPGTGKYYKLGEIWWSWTENTGFEVKSGSYHWKTDTGGCWVGHAKWTYNDELKSSGWAHDLTKGTHTLAGPAGASISLKCTRADLSAGALPQEITWNEADSFADNSPDTDTKSPVYKYTFSGAANENIKFLLVLENI